MDEDHVISQSHLDLEERVRRRAHEIWASRAHDHQSDTALEDWLSAEREVLGSDAGRTAQERATVVGPAAKSERSLVHGSGEA